jgi:hypothetical protein
VNAVLAVHAAVDRALEASRRYAKSSTTQNLRERDRAWRDKELARKRCVAIFAATTTDTTAGTGGAS